MTTHVSDIFQTPTELRLEKLSFCALNVKSLQNWLAPLSIMPFGDSAHALFNALLEISVLKCSEELRFDLVQSLHPHLDNVLTSLEKHFLNQGLVSTERNSHLIELATLIHCHLAKIYIDLARRSHQQLLSQKMSWLGFLKQKRVLNQVRMQTTYAALQQITALFYQQNMLYRTPVKGQWLIANQLLEWAMQHHFDQTYLNLPQQPTAQLDNIAQAYARLSLLEIFNTHQIRPAEIQGLYLCSLDWAKLVQILPKETTSARYVLDATKDAPPVYNNQQAKARPNNIYLATHKLLEHFTEIQRKQSEYLSSNEKIFLTPALHFHIHNLLTNQAGRRSERYDYSAPLKAFLGLSVAHFYLSKGKDFYQTLNLNAPNTLSQQSTLFQPDPTSSQLNNPVSREARQIYATEVVNISLNGYRIRWIKETPKNLKTGELIFVQENTQTQWRCATIRWIKQSPENKLELGLEILGQHMYPCAVHIRSEQQLQNYYSALLIQNIQLDLIKHSLILPGLPLFREKQTIFLRLGNTEIKVYLVKALLITQSFMQFEYELLNEEQQPLIEDFMTQMQHEIKNHDLWEALK